MPKQTWMHLGMPDKATELAHVNWLNSLSTIEYETIKELYNRVMKG
jgi:hypothetical protein